MRSEGTGGVKEHNRGLLSNSDLITWDEDCRPTDAVVALDSLAVVVVDPSVDFLRRVCSGLGVAGVELLRSNFVVLVVLGRWVVVAACCACAKAASSSSR